MSPSVGVQHGQHANAIDARQPRLVALQAPRPAARLARDGDTLEVSGKVTKGAPLPPPHPSSPPHTLTPVLPPCARRGRTVVPAEATGTPLSLLGFNLEEAVIEGVKPMDPADLDKAMALVK